MCPACIATAGWIAAGTASAGGLAALAVGAALARRLTAWFQARAMADEPAVS